MPITSTLDLSNVPATLDGMWVVFRASDHAELGSGETPDQALADARVLADDPNILLARIPSRRVPVTA